jgi:plastocyanin
MKEILGTIGFATVLAFILFSPLGKDYDSLDFNLLQEKKDRIEISILVRGFVVGNPHYAPENVTAKVGTLIVWTNFDQVHHTVTNDQGIQGKLEGRIFDSGPIAPRSQFLLDTSRLLDDVYPYHCTIHPWVKGMLTLVTEPINVTTDKSLYRVGEMITISGSAYIPSPSVDDSSALPKNLANVTIPKSVSLKILDSKNELFLSKDVPTSAGGKYSYTFFAEEPDIYTLKVGVNGFVASTTFQVTEIAEAKDKVTLGSIEFEDKNGSSLTSAKVGQQILIKTPIRNALQTSQDYVYIVQVKDSNEATVLLTWKQGSITAKGISTPFIGWTPKEEGTYSVEIFVWSALTLPEPLSSHVETAVITVRK